MSDEVFDKPIPGGVTLDREIVANLYQVCKDIDEKHKTNCGPTSLYWNLYWVIQRHLEGIKSELQQK